MLQISNAQIMTFNEDLNHDLIQYVKQFLKHQYPVETKSISEADIHRRCALFVKQCADLAVADKVDVLRLGEIVFKLEPSMDLTKLDASLQDCLKDRRFSFEKRVDIVTLRLAFPLEKC